RPQAVSTPPPGIDLMAALKRSLAQEIPVTGSASARERRAKPTADRRQRSLLLPVAGGGRRKAKPPIDPAAAGMRPRKTARALQEKELGRHRSWGLWREPGDFGGVASCAWLFVKESRSRCGGWQNAAGEIIDSVGKRRRAAGFLAI